MNYCDPKLHDGERVPASYLVGAVVPTEPLPSPSPAWERYYGGGFSHSWSCCPTHLPAAVADLLVRTSDATDVAFLVRPILADAENEPATLAEQEAQAERDAELERIADDHAYHDERAPGCPLCDPQLGRR